MLAAGLLLAGCASSTPARHATTPARSPSFVARPGTDAAAIAGHITGCTGVAAGSVGAHPGDMSSTASCTLDGHTVIVDSWAAMGDAMISPQLKAGPLFYAYGEAWTAFTADQGADAAHTTLQEQLTNDAAGLFAESTDGDRYPPASLDAQQRIAQTVAAALGGTVGHLTA